MAAAAPSSAGTANAPIATPPAAATRGRRHSAAFANASPIQVQAYSASAPSSPASGSPSPSSESHAAKTTAPVASQPAKLLAGMPS